ncbi:hypothetical protein [Tateyamaria pelophila]|uniref:hypothetical protein n=1 Tax=Tateyamaria pelophila TaxID=328415 RepID=UPI001CBFD04D|nr:hypothetical protein [Tateyamaria pelophila]
MPIPKRTHFIDTLDELKEYFDKLKEIDAQREQAEDILRKIEEVREALKDENISEREAFGLMRLLIECIKDVAPEIPVFTQFLELYIAALKTTESFLDNVLDNYGPPSEARKRYCEIREAVEDQMDASDEDLDEETFDDEAHARTLEYLGYPFNTEGKKLRDFWNKKKEKEHFENEAADAEDIKDEVQDAADNPGPPEEEDERWGVIHPPSPPPIIVDPPQPPSPQELCCAKHGTTRPTLDERQLVVRRERISGSITVGHPCGIASVKLEIYGFPFGSNDSRLSEEVELAPKGAPKTMGYRLKFKRPRWSRGIYFVVTVRSVCGSVYRKGFANGR